MFIDSICIRTFHLLNTFTMASSAPLVKYMQAQPQGWQAARAAIQAGLTKEKDTVICLNMSNAIVQTKNSKRLREEVASMSNNIPLSQVVEALKKRDPAAGGQVFFIEEADGSCYMQAAIIKIAASASTNPEVYTKAQWEAKQKNEQKQ
jgi:hypothetical protein